MHLIENNKSGRILIKSSQIEVLVYEYITDLVPNVNCYAVSYDESVINVYLKDISNADFKKLSEAQEFSIIRIREILGLYVEKINMHIK